MENTNTEAQAGPKSSNVETKFTVIERQNLAKIIAGNQSNLVKVILAKAEDIRAGVLTTSGNYC